MPRKLTEPLQEIHHRCAEASNTAENRTLATVAAAVARRRGEFDAREVWSLRQEALGLLDALVDRTISQ